MGPKISIIVPVYNVEKYIRKCIDSILKQTFTDYELILVNDGSPDNCGSICDDYAKRDSRIKVIHKKNNGLSSARNAGIDIAKGKYIAFVDSDDFIDKRMYESLYTLAELHSSDVVICDVLEVDEDKLSDKENESKTKEFKIQHFTDMEALSQLYVSNDSMGRGNERWIYAVNKLYRRYIFDSLRYKEARIYEDEFIVHEVYFHCKKVTSIPASFYYYVQRPNSIINSPFSVKRFDRVFALKERADFFKKVGLTKLHEKAFKCYLETLLWNYQAGKIELNNVSRELNHLKMTLSGSMVSLSKNPYITWKQKIMVMIFQINPSAYFFVSIPTKKRLFKST